MSTSIRQYLLNELNVEENKNLMNISKFIRVNTKLDQEEKCECCVCKARNSQMFPHEANTEFIYNHHVMKVEYMAILADRFNLCYVSPSKKKKRIDDLKPNDYRYVNGFSVYSPRVSVCDTHHTMFHELVGDNELDIIRQIKVDEAENLVSVFEDFNDNVRGNCIHENKDSQNLKEYKDRYQSIWDETLLKSMVRLNYVMKINQLKSQLDNDATNEELVDTFYRYQNVIEHINGIINETIDFDEDKEVKLPDVEIFTADELTMLEEELEQLDFSVLDRYNDEKEILEVEDYANLNSEKNRVKTSIKDIDRDEDGYIEEYDTFDLSSEDYALIISELYDDIKDMQIDYDGFDMDDFEA